MPGSSLIVCSSLSGCPKNTKEADEHSPELLEHMMGIEREEDDAGSRPDVPEKEQHDPDGA
jgi:hypothetical protein